MMSGGFIQVLIYVGGGRGEHFVPGEIGVRIFLPDNYYVFSFQSGITDILTNYMLYLDLAMDFRHTKNKLTK